MSKRPHPQLTLFPVDPYRHPQLALFPVEAFTRSSQRPRPARTVKGKEGSHE